VVNKLHQINSGKEPQYPCIKSRVDYRAIQGILEKKKILFPTRIQTMDHPTSGTKAILTKLCSSQNFNLQQATRAWSWPLYPLKRKLYPLYWRLGGPEGQSDRCTKSSVHTGIQSPDSPVHSESLYPCHEGIQGEWRHNSILTSELDGRQWLILHPCHHNPGMEPMYSLNGRLDGPQVLSGLVQKI
jgi:hypothetical protein